VLERASAVVGRSATRSEVHRARSAGPLRLLCPRAAGDAAWIVTSSLGGGLVDGDALELEIAVESGATCVVTSQASTKVYKGSSSQRTTVRVHGDATALVVPDPIVPFRNARFDQVTSVELARGASLVLADAITAGRVAHGERWSAEHVATTLELAIAGKRVLLDRVVLARDATARMRRFEALGTALLVGPRFADLAAAELARVAAEPVVRGAGVVVAASPLADGVLIRVVGDRIEAVLHTLRDHLRAACIRAGEDPWARKW
jgi:urease accessory protein